MNSELYYENHKEIGEHVKETNAFLRFELDKYNKLDKVEDELLFELNRRQNSLIKDDGTTLSNITLKIVELSDEDLDQYIQEADNEIEQSLKYLNELYLRKQSLIAKILMKDRMDKK